MKLKNIFSSIGIVAVSVLALSSCGDFLDEGPKTALTEKTSILILPKWSLP